MLIWAGPQAWVNRRMLALRPMVWLGLISYPLYLWHWPLIAFPRILRGEEIEQTTRLIMVLGAVVLAWATYRWVELPLRRRPATPRMAKALSGAMALVLLAGLSAWTSHGWAARPWAPQVVNRGEIGAAPYFAVIAQRYHPCLPLAIRQQALVGEQYLRCPQSQAGPAQDLAIIGDSHGEALFPGLAEAMPQRNLVFYGIGEGLPITSNPDYAQVFAHVRASPSIRTVIIAAVWPRKLAKLDEAAWRADLTATETVLPTVSSEAVPEMTTELSSASFRKPSTPSKSLTATTGAAWSSTTSSEVLELLPVPSAMTAVSSLAVPDETLPGLLSATLMST